MPTPKKFRDRMTEQVCLRLPKDIYDKAKGLAIASGVDVPDIVRKALEEMLEKRESADKNQDQTQ